MATKTNAMRRIAGRGAARLARASVVVLAMAFGLTGCGGDEGAGPSARERAEMAAELDRMAALQREKAEVELANALGLGERPLRNASGETLTALYDLSERHGDRALAATFPLDDPDASLSEPEAEDLFGLREAASVSEIVEDGVRAEMRSRAEEAEGRGEPPYSAYSSPGRDLDAAGWGRFVRAELADDLSRVPTEDLEGMLSEERRYLAGGYAPDAMNLVGANFLADDFADDWRLNLEEEALAKTDDAVIEARAAYAGAIEAELAERERAGAGGGEPS